MSTNLSELRSKSHHPFRYQAYIGQSSPNNNVLQVWVGEPILKILRRHNSISPGSIDKVIERNMTLLALRVHICSGNGPTLWFTLFLELNRRNFSFLENSDTAGSRMLEEDMIKF